MSGANIYRRTFLALLLGVAGVLNAAGPSEAQNGKFTEWGWPQPYEKDLRQVGRVAEGEGLVAAAGRLPVALVGPEQHQHRDGQGRSARQARHRGEVAAFGSGPAINEVLVSGKVQVANAGNFPFTSLLDKQIPVKSNRVGHAEHFARDDRPD